MKCAYTLIYCEYLQHFQSSLIDCTHPFSSIRKVRGPYSISGTTLLSSCSAVKNMFDMHRLRITSNQPNVTIAQQCVLTFFSIRFLLPFRRSLCQNSSFTCRHQHDLILELFPQFWQRILLVLYGLCDLAGWQHRDFICNRNHRRRLSNSPGQISEVVGDKPERRWLDGLT